MVWYSSQSEVLLHSELTGTPSIQSLLQYINEEGWRVEGREEGEGTKGVKEGGGREGREGGRRGEEGREEGERGEGRREGGKEGRREPGREEGWREEEEGQSDKGTTYDASQQLTESVFGVNTITQYLH